MSSAEAPRRFVPGARHARTRAPRQPLPKADSLTPDRVRIPHRILDLADGSDPNPLAGEILPFTYKQVEDACHRAVAWRLHIAK